MVLRSRSEIKTNTDQHSKMSEKNPYGNKVSDIHAQNGFVTSDEKRAGNKISDSHNSTPSVNSVDSCTKLTIDKEDESSCMGDNLGLSVVKVIVCFICGIFFGIALEKGRGDRVQKRKLVQYIMEFGTKQEAIGIIGEKTDNNNDGEMDDQKYEEYKMKQKSAVLDSLVKMSVILFCGIVLGFAADKGRVFEPKTIRDQMVFESFIMLKMFLAATATGQLVFCVLSVIPKTKEYFQAAVKAYVGCFSDKGIITSGLGTFILGIGMTLAGACPGMVLVQVGTWTPNGIFTLLGCLIGALTYGMVAPYIVRVTKPKQCFEKHTVFQKFNLPFIAFGLPMAVCLGVVVFLLEYFWDWEKDLRSLGRDLPPYNNIATAVAWRPFVSGMLIGVLQLPLVFALKDTLGSSSSYCTVVSQWVVTKRLQELFPYLASKRCGLDNWWQVIYVCGAILGGAISALASDTISSAAGARIHTAIIGGLLMLWGARLAAGCTSGHGLSGMGLLAWLSFIAVPFMFAGGIVTAFAMQATGALDDYASSTGS